MTVAPRERKGHGDRLSYYHFRRTTLFASRADQRFSYCLYVPEAFDEHSGGEWPILVLIHGTERAAQGYRDAFVEFAEAHGCFVLAPLFPAGIDEPGELNNYKYMEFRGIRFDTLLLDIVAEVAETWGIDVGRFLIHGFSGGGHFAHRFFYLHPERLRGVSIGAPGVVTLLDPDRPWWEGVGDLEERFGDGIDLDAMRRVPVQMVIGENDLETWEINDPDAPGFVQGRRQPGPTRHDRLEGLRDSFERHGIVVAYEVVPGVAHEGWGLLSAVKSFFARVLAEPRADPAEEEGPRIPT